MVSVLVDFAVVVVDDVAHLFTTAVDDPVMAVEGQLVTAETTPSGTETTPPTGNGSEHSPHPVAEACSGGELLGLPPKPFQCGPTGTLSATDRRELLKAHSRNRWVSSPTDQTLSPFPQV